MHVKKSNEEVLVATDNVVTLESPYIEFLKKAAAQTRRKRIRLCTHKNERTLLQEMFIVHTKDTYVKPHKHLRKIESLFIIEGCADILLFSDTGRITSITKMGDYQSGLVFYYRIEHPVYHTMVIKSPYLVFHEVTNGPFNRTETISAPWAPDEQNSRVVQKYLKDLRKASQ